MRDGMKKSKTSFSISFDKSRQGIYYIYYYPDRIQEKLTENPEAYASGIKSRAKRIRKSLNTKNYREAYERALKIINDTKADAEHKSGTPAIPETTEEKDITLSQLRKIMLLFIL